MDHLPIWLASQSLDVLIVGGAEAAARKVRMACRAGCKMTVVAPWVNDEIAEREREGKLVHLAREFDDADVHGRDLVYAATGVGAVDEAVSAAAKRSLVKINVTDRPELSTFIVPGIVDRSPLIIGISSGGTAPILVRELRARFESLLPANLGKLANFAGQFRRAVKANIGDAGNRRRCGESFFSGPVAKAYLEDETKGRESMLDLINRPSQHPVALGMVHIVGAGPGNPDLLTLRALQVMQTADVVFHDRLIGPEILDYARRDAERVYVGKAKGNHALSQDKINQSMADRALAGERVVRLKGGDAFIFGRGGEETAYLRSRGVTVEVVPGITAAAGAAASAGIPLTHRGMASAVTFVTAQVRAGDPDVDWATLALLRQTLVIYMGLSGAADVARRLIAGGLNGTTPAAVVSKATQADQKVVTGTLAGLDRMVAQSGIESPALLIVGDVAALADEDALQELALTAG
jgi:uroporphyrin-III C-methyltransferase/precorrin-2 dehydrogenase/sirohydrochlorin ferrochelatase